jgi:hypothetical protein
MEGEKYLQITTPISPGSSGGGLFDKEGRLIGQTTFYLVEGQQFNFAVPVEHIHELQGADAWYSIVEQNVYALAKREGDFLREAVSINPEDQKAWDRMVLSQRKLM